MRFRLEQFLSGPLEAVESALTDAAFVEALAGLPNLGSPVLLDHRVDGSLVHQRVRYAFAGDLSPAVTTFVDPAKLTWVEASTTDRRTHATEFEIQPDHYANRLTCSGRFTLAADGDHATRRTAEGDLSVHIPFVGRKAESAIVDGLREHARLEADILNEWLARR
ncbi:MAG TPA: DUF2505 domain-containing protein [Acidimicrobiales bacterium]|nr:DUF2505 domain-containing protein [Acidimicrobiales bacterium]